MNPNDRRPESAPRAIGAALALVLGAAVIVGALIGVVPGLVLGFFDMHLIGAISGSVVWGAWYFITRMQRTGRVSMITVAMTLANSLGLLLSVLLFGSISSALSS